MKTKTQSGPESSNSKSRRDSESKSSPLLRQFLRFAISSIVYYRIGIDDNSDSGVAADQELSRYRGCGSASSNTDVSEVPQQKSPTTKSKAKAFIDKDYCGIKEMKFMDAVGDDGTILDPNVFTISLWMEKGVLSSLDQLRSFKFCTLTTKLCTDDVLSTSLETFHFQFVVHASQDNSSAIPSSSRSGLRRKSIMEQLKTALEDVQVFAMRYGFRDAENRDASGDNSACTTTTPAFTTISSMNIVLEFDSKNENDMKKNGDGVKPQPELFTNRSIHNPMKMFQQHSENDQTNAIVEIDCEEDENFEIGGDGDENSPRCFPQGLGQKSQSQESLDHDSLSEGRQEIARIYLPSFDFVISRDECVVLSDADNYANGDDHKDSLNRLFPQHFTQIQRQKEKHQLQSPVLTKKQDRIVNSPGGTGHNWSRGKKRNRNKRSNTPPLTPMRTFPGKERQSLSEQKSILGSIQRKLNVTSAQNESSVFGQHTPTTSSRRERNYQQDLGSGNTKSVRKSISPHRSPLYITPKGVKHGKDSPRSGSPSEAPTYVVPLSGKRMSASSPFYVSTPMDALNKKSKQTPRSGSLSEAPTYVVPFSSSKTSTGGGVSPLSNVDSTSPRAKKLK